MVAGMAADRAAARVGAGCCVKARANLRRTDSQLEPSGNEKTKLSLVHEIQAQAMARTFCRETELRDAVAEPVPLRRDVAGAGKLEHSTGRGHIRAASAETARWQMAVASSRIGRAP